MLIRTLTLASVCVAALAGCQKQEFNTDMPVKEVMGHIIDPGAWAYWDRSGEVMGPDGVWVSRVPAVPESIPEDPNTLDDDVRRIELELEWHRAISGAAQVAEAGNMLRLPGRIRRVTNDQGDWSKLSARLTEVSNRAMEAAEAHDGQAMFDLGGEMYEVCTTCHEKYLIPAVEEGKMKLPDRVDAEGKPIKN